MTYCILPYFHTSLFLFVHEQGVQEGTNRDRICFSKSVPKLSSTPTFIPFSSFKAICYKFKLSLVHDTSPLRGLKGGIGILGVGATKPGEEESPRRRGARSWSQRPKANKLKLRVFCCVKAYSYHIIACAWCVLWCMWVFFDRHELSAIDLKF